MLNAKKNLTRKSYRFVHLTLSYVATLPATFECDGRVRQCKQVSNKCTAVRKVATPLR